MKILLPLFVLVALSNVSFAGLSPDLQALVDENKKGYSDCKAFNETLKATAQVDSTGEAFKDKATALKVLRLLEEHQATQPSTKKVYAYVFNKGDQATEEEIDAVWESEKCSSLIAYYSNLKRLMLGVETFEFSPGEKRRVTTEVLKHVKEEMSAPATLMSALVDTALLKLLVEKSLVEVPPGLMDKLSETSQKGTQLKEESRKSFESAPSAAAKAQTFKELPGPYRKRLLAEIKKQWVGIDQVRKELLGIIDKVKVG